MKQFKSLSNLAVDNLTVVAAGSLVLRLFDNTIYNKVIEVKQVMAKVIKINLQTYNHLATTKYQVATQEASNITLSSDYSEAKDYLQDVI